MSATEHLRWKISIGSCNGLVLSGTKPLPEIKVDPDLWPHMASLNHNELRKTYMQKKLNMHKWCHQMETFSVLLAISAGNSPVLGEFPAQRPVRRSLDIFFDLHPNKRLSKQWWGWWFETPSCPLWRHCNDSCIFCRASISMKSRTSRYVHIQMALNTGEFFFSSRSKSYTSSECI